MPELPEVETTVRYLRRKVLNRTFLDVWTDSAKTIKRPSDFNSFKKLIKGKRIKGIRRRAKNIIFDFSDGFSLLVHQKMTGHLLVGTWRLNGAWESTKKGSLREPVNKYIHLMFWLDNNLMLALSDLRKFAKVEIWKTKELSASPGFKKLGPEPLDPSFSFKKFKEVIKSRKGRIKQILMDQSIIAGIGNIYADEILWEVRIHPLKSTLRLEEKELKDIYRVIRKILKEAIRLKGTSVSDFRDPEGRPGSYGKVLKVYQREGEKCPRCKKAITRIKINGRSAHFCPICQKT